MLTLTAEMLPLHHVKCDELPSSNSEEDRPYLRTYVQSEKRPPHLHSSRWHSGTDLNIAISIAAG